MIVDISDVLLGGARDRIRYTKSMLDPMEDSPPSERVYYIRNRCVIACRALAEALELVRVFRTKRV